MGDIKNRVKAFKQVKASDLVDNPRNWRTHPAAQRAALEGIMEEIGFAGAVLTREMKNGKLEIIDGHLRKDVAEAEEIPVLITDLTRQEADLLLAVYDPITGLAEADEEIFSELLNSVESKNGSIQELLGSLKSDIVLPNEDDWNSAAGKIPSGDKSEFTQITFTLHESQAEIVKQAIDKAKSGGIDNSVNENSNGNALFEVCAKYNG